MNPEEEGQVEISREIERNEPHEGLIVLIPDSVVQPLAVMVEPTHSPVAFPTMLSLLLNVREANISHVNPRAVIISRIHHCQFGDFNNFF
jgi:hypothetical protein